ncbi:hypothetical protein MMC19_004296 [Ptychographa xylographoides]|nr:hypothetical protein [Ptychographa xylographoides]
MSSNTSEIEFKKPKQPITSVANRDKPLFANRRPPPRLQQRSEFFTDSLNTSYIPSPSPPKGKTATGVGAKPRQALNGKSLAAAFKATSDPQRSSKSSFSASTESQRQKQQSPRKSRPEPTVTRGSPSPAVKKSTPHRAITRTPSPPHARQYDSLQSPTSDASPSSPPRGLAEAYQRIQDEEFLAGREDDSVDEPDSQDDFEEDQGQAMYQDRLQGPLDSDSPLSHKGSQRASLREPIEKDFGIGDPPVDQLSNMNYSDEDNSQLFSIDAGGDTFDRIPTQYDKDERRLRGVLGNDLQPFKRSRIRERNGLTTENLQRKDGSSKSSSSTLGSPSISSKGSDPSLNIPQAWGRKGRGNNTWLSRISRESGKFTGDVPSPRSLLSAEGVDKGGKRSSSPVVDWLAAAAEVPLPSVETEFMQTTSTSRGSTPASLVRPLQIQRQSSSDRIRRWEFLDEDFTAHSLQVSDSPPIRIRSAALDLIREREIHNLEKSAVTTNRLGELREKKSLEQVSRRSGSASTDVAAEDRALEYSPERARHTILRKPSFQAPLEKEEDLLIRQEEPLLGDEAGEPISNSPIVVVESAGTGKDKKEIEDEAKGLYEGHPHDKRSDSRDLLRQLARATSASPRPSPTDPREEQGTRGRSVGSHHSKHNSEVVEPRSSGKDDLSDGPGHDKIELTMKLNSRLGVTEALASTPQQPKPNFYLKTPLVTGAWIETPLPRTGRGPPMPTPTDLEDEKKAILGTDSALNERGPKIPVKESTIISKPASALLPSLAETAPLLPKSALAAIIEKAKRNNREAPHRNVDPQNQEDTLILDDSTIQSLEELLVGDDTDRHQTDVLTPPRSTSPLSPPDSNPKLLTKPTTHAPEEIVQDKEEGADTITSYQILTSRLSRLGSSIHDARKGIASLERAVSASSSAVGPTPQNAECVEGGEFHDFIWPCARCGCAGAGRDAYWDGALGSLDWWTVTVPLPRLWTWRKEDWRPRLTWLGVVTAVAWLGVAAEWIVT